MFTPSQTQAQSALEKSAFAHNLPEHLKSHSEKGNSQPVLQLTEEQAKNVHIGIVQSAFNAEVTNALKNACLKELLSCGVLAPHISLVEVPGALEIPLALQALAQIEEPQPFHALIALGCIIRGETYHFELVANESASGVSQVSLDFHVPVVNAILTTENTEQAHARQEVKGREAAQVALHMIKVLETWA
jgi:6,7-dimethyl-8-ribityllumazine synthase